VAPFSKGDNSKRVKIYKKYFKIFFSRSTGPISTRLSTNHPWGEGIQVCTNEGRRPSLRGIIARVKIYKKYLKILSRTTGPISTTFGTNQPWGVRGFKFVQMKGGTVLKGEIIAKE
jgi:hypothetical protein